MQSNPRIVVNVLVISVNILVNLLVKLAKLRVRGAMGLRVRGIHLGEARTISNAPISKAIMRLLMRLLMRMLVRLL